MLNFRFVRRSVMLKLPTMKLSSIHTADTATSALRAWIAAITLLALPVPAAEPFADFVRKTEPLTPSQEQKTFHVPPGFEVQLVASEPDISKPMNLAFDSAGRLWLTESREYPFPAPLDQPGGDAIKVLSDFDKNGRAKKITTFAQGLNIPIGLYPWSNGVVAFSIPNIYFFQDTNRDGRADVKELVLGRFGFEKDTHGMTSAFRRGFDGWLYADHGFNNDTTLTARDGSTIRMNSGNTYRFKPDGSRVEQFTWGQVNPFGLMFDPLGDLWSADCHSSPIYQLLRGAYYPSFGKPHDGLGFAPEICRHTHGSTAIAGIVFYAADAYPEEYRENTFIGNVMTCRINRDSFNERGSTRVAKEEPDFLTCDDPWFRPVDVQLGPDGAIYVADFYNRIIGHYEVALDHPGRDRERGRIWRIVYRGREGGRPSSASPFDVSRATAKPLIEALGDPNLTRRMLAMHELVDRIGKPAVAPLKKTLSNRKVSPWQKVHGLWVLYRLGQLDEPTLADAAHDADMQVRVHAMRVLAEKPEWSPQQRGHVLAGLRDQDAHVQRAAADALGMHPNFAHIRPLLDARHKVSAEDSLLLHVIKMALRNQLPGHLARLQNSLLNEQDQRALAEVAVAVKTADAGHFLLGHVQTVSVPQQKLTDYLRHAARFASMDRVGELAQFTRQRFAEDVDFQLALFKSVSEGTSQRGAELDPAIRDWGIALAETLFDPVDPGLLEWRNFPLEGAETLNPWFLQKRPSSDGNKSAVFLCSLPPGGEQLTGVLRSKVFTVPETLAFFLAGHDGTPDRPLSKKNLVRLRHAKSGEVLAESSPPRNDVAQKVTWDLTKNAGQPGLLEIVDGHTSNAYAWLALGRLEPAVVRLPVISPSQTDKRQIAGVELAGFLKLDQFSGKLAALLTDRHADPMARAAAAKALGQLEINPHLDPAGNILLSSVEPMKLREQVAEVLGATGDPKAIGLLAESLKTAPSTLQKQVALALAGSISGAEALLMAVASGGASPRVLQDTAVRERLLASKPRDVAERIQLFTAHLSPPSEERQKLLAARRAAFQRGAGVTATSTGAEIFKQQCSVCHAVDGQGASIAPQLDGVGARGADRLLEDILDPNRNVDRAFRTLLVIRKDGEVESGLLRREEGEMVVLADSTGKELSIPKADVREQRESETSLMPDNFADLLSVDDLNHLLAFLLSKTGKPATQ